jgi:pimeloyl-ACP methyl ester carboxylesterase
MALFNQPWGIDLDKLTVKSRIWIGMADRNVPLPAVQALASALPNCELTELPGAGHLWVAQNADQVMRWLSAEAACEPAASAQRPASLKPQTDAVSG